MAVQAPIPEEARDARVCGQPGSFPMLEGAHAWRWGGSQDAPSVSFSLHLVLRRKKKSTNNANTNIEWVRDQIKILPTHLGRRQEKEHREAIACYRIGKTTMVMT